ncbi:MAG: hypothetical protein AB7Q23_08250 [Hyphomonadaceae bacterium]
MIPTDVKTLERFFTNRGIDQSKLEFYNDPAFMKAGRGEIGFLEYYGAWVRMRPRTAEYDVRVRKLVPRIATLLAAEIEKDGQLGACIDGSMILMKILEEEGIWCYGVKGALSIVAPRLPDPTYFWLYDLESAAGHVWIAAPPLEITTLKLQPYSRGEKDLVPLTIVAETARPFTPEPHDYCSSDVLMAAHQQNGLLPLDMHFRLYPGLRRPAEYLPSLEVDVRTAKIRYARGGITVSDGPSLASIVSRKWNGRLAVEVYNGKPGIADLKEADGQC